MGDVILDKRRGIGSNGERVLVLVNAFPVKQLPDFNVHHYDIDISPEAPPRVNRQIYTQMKAMGLFGTVAAVYDGRKNIYAPSKLPFPGETASADVFLPDSDRPGREDKGRTYHISVKLVAQVNLYELGLFIKNQASPSSNILMAINALNVMIRNDPAMIYPSKGASFYPTPRAEDAAFVVRGGLEMWGGYFTSIRPSPGKLVVNMDRTAMPFIQSGDLVSVAAKFMNMRDPSELSRAMDRGRVQLERFVKGLIIVTRSLTSVSGMTTQKKKFKIRALSRVPASEMTFEDEQSREITIQTYFQKQYNYILRYPNLPCIQVTKKAWYPMEICEVEKGNKYTRKLNPDQVAEALKFTTQPPTRRLQLIREGLGYLGLTKSETLRSWQFGVDATPMQAKARTLTPPVLTYVDARAGGEAITQPRDGSWDIRGKRFTACGKVERWMVVVFDTPQGTGGRNTGFPLPAVRESVTQFVQACQSMGIVFTLTQPVIFHAGDTMDVRQAFLAAAAKSGYDQNKTPQLVVTYVPQKNARQYPIIKQLGDVFMGVATQNMVIQKVKTARPSYYQNVALKVNVKLSGLNQVIKNGILPNFSKSPTIIFGADVSHPGPGSDAPSIAAVVGSHDVHGFQYSTVVRVQNNREEILIDLESMAITLIKKFFKSSKQKPARIIFYRDGVSEGQYADVCRNEIRALKSACVRIQADYTPPITYIICAKRHHIRFFPGTTRGADRSGNVHAGTVIDQDIVHPIDNDFYLLSHGGLLGTSRPCHYTVLLDENKLPPDVIQQLTYNLSYIYPRSTRSVSIVSPAYYAHHVATRARAHLGSDFGDDSTAVSTASSDRRDEIRDQKLQSARERLRQVHPNLESTMYFM